MLDRKYIFYSIHIKKYKNGTNIIFLLSSILICESNKSENIGNIQNGSVEIENRLEQVSKEWAT